MYLPNLSAYHRIANVDIINDIRRLRVLHQFLGIQVPSSNVAEESDSETEQRQSRRSGAQAAYDFANITNTADWTIRDTLDEAQRNLLNVSPAILSINQINHN